MVAAVETSLYPPRSLYPRRPSVRYIGNPLQLTQCAGNYATGRRRHTCPDCCGRCARFHREIRGTRLGVAGPKFQHTTHYLSAATVSFACDTNDTPKIVVRLAV